MSNACGEKAVILLSGGLDSATSLAIARLQGYACYTLSFDYGQRQRSELVAAANVSGAMGAIQHKIVEVGLSSIGGSALTDASIAVPTQPTVDIPVTYVPARNTIFLSIALAWAEVLEARHIFIGVNAVDYLNYPDCRPEYVAAFQAMANLATKAGVEGFSTQIHAPLLRLSKREIVLEGMKLGVDYSLTVSCYQSNEKGQACGLCNSCNLRRKGFIEAGVADPTHYKT